MNKKVLVFPSAEAMAAFVLECRIIKMEFDLGEFTLTGEIPDDCLKIAFEQYGASISRSPDFILGDNEPVEPQG